MKLRFDQLEQHLKSELKPIYFLSGDEPLQMMEAADIIRAAARADGYSEREILHVEAGFDWNALLASANAMSLFAERKVIDLRLRSGKPGDAGAKVLRNYCENPSPDNLLLVSSAKLDRSQTRSKWYQELDCSGVTIEIWPVEASQLGAWITQRLRKSGIDISPQAAALLADRVEGNLMAASQELEKLCLLNPELKSFDVEAIEEGVADSARYTVFSLADAALSGDARRVTRMIDGLRQEGIESVLVLWSLSREIRAVVKLHQQTSIGVPISQAYRAAGVWDKRKPLFQSALNRVPSRVWQQLLMRCGLIDRMIKGSEQGNPWSELLQLSLLMCGKRIV